LQSSLIDLQQQEINAMPIRKIHSHIPTVSRRIHPAVTATAAFLGFVATLAAVLLVRK
jgi:hypothetical protein